MSTSFGYNVLKSLGWKEGCGLGKHENGILKPIKPKLKFDSEGVGFKRGEEYTFQWWDHVYNKITKNLSVLKDEEGKIQISQKNELAISTKKSASDVKDNSSSPMNYFVKGSVLQGATEVFERDLLSKKCSEESHELIKKFSDEELFQKCGGLTAHKGARHGLRMTGKLARLEQQEKEFIAMKGKSSVNVCTTNMPETREHIGKKRKHHCVKSNESFCEDSSEPFSYHDSSIPAMKDQPNRVYKRKKHKQITDSRHHTEETNLYHRKIVTKDDSVALLSQTTVNKSKSARKKEKLKKKRKLS